MIIFSNCKINIGLNVVNKRNDGFHNLETIFYPLPLFDVLELIDADKTELTLLGLPVPGDVANNIVLKAYQLLKKEFPRLPSVHFYLLKNIPIGAGLGAGSANGTNALLALNKKYQLQLNKDQLSQFALQLGSDCPFFIENQPVTASGRGEQMQPIRLELSNYELILVNPGIPISTPWAFQQIQPQLPAASLKELIALPITEWKNLIKNDFEKPVFKAHPEIARIKEQLYANGALFSLMSGSGSTIFGLFDKNSNPRLSFPDNYFVKTISLSEQE